MMKPIIIMIAAILLGGSARAQSNYWQPVNSGTPNHLLSISFGSAKVGYVAGTDSTLLRTPDGGISWTKLAPKGLRLTSATPDIIHVNFISPGTGYAITSSRAFPLYKGNLHKTTDSGKTWTWIQAGNIAPARTYFFDANNGFQIGSAFFAGHTVIRQTSAVWGTERNFNFSSADFLYGIDFLNNRIGIVGGSGGYVYRTFDGGATWDTVKTMIDTTINAIKFLPNGIVMAATDNITGSLIFSADTGRTWEIDFNMLTFAYPGLKGLAISRRDSFVTVGHAAFSNAGVILWNDNRAVASVMMTSQPLNDVAMRDDSIAYAVGDSGAIYSNRRALLSAGPSGKRGADLKLYPNPAAEVCYTASAQLHTVRLYDMSGRLLRSEGRPALRHTISLGGLSPGHYLLQAIPQGGKTEYRKLLVE